MRSPEIMAIAERFRGGPAATALLCKEVLVLDRPILCVSRKGFVWQFLCGLDHQTSDVYEGDDDPRIVTVVDAVKRDPSVAPVATMNDHHFAWRERVGAPWTPGDDTSLWWF